MICFDFLLISLCIYSINISFVVIIACDKLLFSFSFQDPCFICNLWQFDYDVSQCGLLYFYIYPSWSSLHFLSFYIHFSSQMWESFSHSFFKFCLLFSLLSGTTIHNAYILFCLSVNPPGFPPLPFFFFCFFFMFFCLNNFCKSCLQIHWFYLLPGHICCWGLQ